VASPSVGPPSPPVPAPPSWRSRADRPRPTRGSASAAARLWCGRRGGGTETCQHLAVNEAVACDHVAAAALGHAGEVRERTAGLADDEARGADVPPVDNRLDAAIDGPLGDEHVGTEIAET